MNMKRVLPYINRSGASVIRLPPKFFSYQLAPAAVSGTSKCTWSYGHAGVWAVGRLAAASTAASAKEIRRKSDRITRSWRESLQPLRAVEDTLNRPGRDTLKGP